MIAIILKRPIYLLAHIHVASMTTRGMRKSNYFNLDENDRNRESSNTLCRRHFFFQHQIGGTFNQLNQWAFLLE